MSTSAGLLLLQEAVVFVERGWCQGADARTGAGTPVDPWKDEAEAWSLLGAIVATLEQRAAEQGDVPLDELAAALYALADVIDIESLVVWNDDPSRSQDEVVRTLRDAQARFEPPGGAQPEFHPN